MIYYIVKSVGKTVKPIDLIQKVPETNISEASIVNASISKAPEVIKGVSDKTIHDLVGAVKLIPESQSPKNQDIIINNKEQLSKNTGLVSH